MWTDVDLEAGHLIVRRSLQRQKGKGLVFVEPKTERSRRTIALPTPLLAALKAHRVRQLQERLFAGSRWQDMGLAFASQIGSPLEPRNLIRSFKGALKKGRVRDTRFHDLRHSAASLMLAQDVPMRVVMELLGHSSIALTANTYSHVMPSLVRGLPPRERLQSFLHELEIVWWSNRWSIRSNHAAIYDCAQKTSISRGVATRRIRTGDLLITNSPKPVNQAKSNQKFPKFSGHFAFPLWLDLVWSAASSRTTRGQILDGKLPSGLSVLEECLYGRQSLCRGASGVG